MFFTAVILFTFFFFFSMWNPQIKRPNISIKRKPKTAPEKQPNQRGKAEIMNNIRACYAALVKLDVVVSGELPLIEAWAADLEGVLAAR